MGTIKDTLDGSSKSSLVYTKPYTQGIDNLKMPIGYQPFKFLQFDGKGNPKQHVGHFVETCNNAGTYSDHLYIDLEANSINSMEQLEHEFLNCFYSTRRIVSMIELTNSRQWKDEQVTGWRNLSLNCKDRLSKTSAIEMCVQGIHWGLRYIIQRIQLKSMKELATQAHDMELSMTSSGEKQEVKRGGKPPTKTPSKESMAVTIIAIKLRGRTANASNENTDTSREGGQRRLTLKEIKSKQYLFLDSDIFGIFDYLLNANLIKLLKIKRPEEAGKTNDPRYCKCHHLISLEEDKTTMNFIFIEAGSHHGNIVSCNATSEQNVSSDGSYCSKVETHIMIEECMLAKTFIDDDLLLGSKPHNRPLFMASYAHERRVNRILIDGGFNQGWKRVLGIIRIQLLMDDISSTVLFHVVDAKMSYNMLLGRPGYMKMVWDWVVKKVLTNDKPFTEVKFHFANTKYYFEKGSRAKKDLYDQIGRKEIKIEALVNLDSDNKATLGEFKLPKELILPLTKLDIKKPQSLKRFVCPVEGAKVEHKEFLNLQMGYNQQECLSLEKLSPRAARKQAGGLNVTQSVLKGNACLIPNAKVGLRFVPRNPIRIVIKKASTNHIIEEEVSSTNYVFDLKRNKVKRISVFDRLGNLRKLRINKRFLKRSKVPDGPKFTEKLRILIPYRMKWRTTLIVSCGKIECTEEEDITTYHITLSKDTIEEDAEAASLELEEGVKATIGELKEVNLGEVDNPRPIYVSTLLTIAEEKAYITLLGEFKDVFAWSYKEMPGLDPKVAVHHLKFLGFIVRHQGIEIEQGKINAILKMPKPRNIHEVKSLQGKLAHIRRFILNLVGQCQPFSRLMKKGIPFEWDEACSNAFNNIKAYLMKPLVLVASMLGHSLVLYIIAQEHSANLLKYVMTKLVLFDRLARIRCPRHDMIGLGPPTGYWDFREFEIVYVSQNAMKGRVLTNFLADHLIPTEWELYDDLPDNDVLRLIGWLGNIEIEHVLRVENKQVDALAKLVSTLVVPEKEARVPICRSWVVPPIFENENYEEEKNHIIEKLSDDPRHRTNIRRHAARFINYKGTLYRRSFDGVFFTMPRLDIVGSMTKSSVGRLYILAATDYFSKWAETISLKEVKKENVADFIRLNIIYRYRVPRYISTNNGKPFCNSATPYALVYSVEVVVHLEQQILSLKIAIQEGLTEEENARLHLEELEALDEKRAFNKKVRSRSFQVGDLVLVVRRPIIITHQTRNKFTSKWDASYVVKAVYTNGVYKLIVEDGSRIGPRNGKFLKCYYP
ncbi:hypothetical protein CDL12_10835 [Handroanthus impetiginosus]|uniref:DNA-directed DNA polymerase n=1 Tax=Handroanthus impetiginosus TaxID=429701 RepID=A0A2G9HG41_9LAMI|nr:hypothetical protein CDL12_10835 [Handroanthus impetiginosus]